LFLVTLDALTVFASFTIEKTNTSTKYKADIVEGEFRLKENIGAK
jgi:hypothetical protein